MSEAKLLEPWRHEVEEVASALGADLDRGLSEQEAEARRLRFGRNALDESAPEPGWRRVVRQLRDPLTVLLLVAAALSLLAWLFERETHWPYEATTVLAVVLLNSVLAVVQEGRAERALSALADLTPASALVLRAGIPTPVPAVLLVPGDVRARGGRRSRPTHG
jgi:Ca2+-transporting ATPase